MSARVLDLYGRPGCHLCDRAREELAALEGELGFAVRVLDIEGDDALLRAYLERIPVGVLDGQQVFELFVDEAALRRALDGGEGVRAASAGGG